jgi:hypothetical protein
MERRADTSQRSPMNSSAATAGHVRGQRAEKTRACRGEEASLFVARATIYMARGEGDGCREGGKAVSTPSIASRATSWRWR